MNFIEKQIKKQKLIRYIEHIVDRVKMACECCDNNSYSKFKDYSFNSLGSCSCTFESALGDRRIHVGNTYIMYKEQDKNLFVILVDNNEIYVISDYLTSKEVWMALYEINNYIFNEVIQHLKGQSFNLDDYMDVHYGTEKPKHITEEFKEYAYNML